MTAPTAGCHSIQLLDGAAGDYISFRWERAYWQCHFVLFNCLQGVATEQWENPKCPGS